MALTKIGRYEVVRSLGTGSDGESYLAEERSSGTRVVVTLLGDGGPGAEQRVEQARRVGALSTPATGLAQVGLHGHTPFFATEHFVGETLTEWLSGNPSLGERLKLVGSLADALNHVHERGVVHGGLEPGAVRITDDG